MAIWQTQMDEDLRGGKDESQCALASLSQRTRPALLRYFQRRGLPLQDAEDAVQDVFLRLSRRPDAVASDHGEAYLFETASSVAIDRHRRARARQEDRHTTYEEARHAVEDYPVDRIVEGREALLCLVESLNRLPERTRHVVMLAQLERLTHPEIASRLGISVSTVERRLAKGLVHLAASLEEIGQ